MSGRVLDPAERFSEAAFGLVMVLGFTGTLSVAASPDEVQTMLVGALGCNIAWGLVDAMMYLLGVLAARGRSLVVARALRADPAEARRVLAEELPEPLLAVLDTADLDAMGKRIAALPEPAARARLQWDDFRGALGVFLLVFLSTLPVVLPFTMIADPVLALRVSNGVAVLLLFVCGWSLARYSGHNPWWVGSAMVVVGAALVAVTIALGG